MANASANPTARTATPLAGWVAWGVVSLFYLYEFLIRVAPSVMEPELQKSFHLSAAGLGAALGAYYYIYAPLQLVVGGLLDEWGTKRVLIPAVLLCVCGCFLEIVGGHPAILIAARLLQGAGSAFAFVGAMHAAAQWFPPERMALVSGMTTALGMLGAIIGNAAVAEFVARTGWQSSLRDAAIFGLVVAAAIFFFLPKPRKAATPRADRKGTAFSRIFGHLRRVILNPQTWIIGFIASCLYLPLSVFGGLWGVPYLTAVADISVVEAARVISVLYVGWLIGGPMAGWLSDHLGRRKAMLLGSTALTLLTTIFLVISPPTSTVGIVILLLAIGLASSVQVVGFAAGLEANPLPAAATSIACVNMIVMLIGGLLQPLVGVLLDHSAKSAGAIDAGKFSADDFQHAMILLPILSLLGVVACFFLKETYGGRTVSEGEILAAEEI
ncbi:MAG: MFS transporter [Chthoniobacterales bacterium]